MKITKYSVFWNNLRFLPGNMDYDNILKGIGEFGPFQRKLYLILNCLSFFQCFQMFLLVFVADKPRWQCSNVASRYLDNNNEYPCYKNGSACQKITFSDEFTSVVTEWNFVCDQEYKANMGQSVMMFGCLVGVITAGRISDQFGRRYVTIISQLSAWCLGFLTAFVQSYTQFLLVRFLCGLFIVGGNMSSFVIMTEVIGPSYRGSMLTFAPAFYALGFGLFSLMAYLFRDWRKLTIAVSIPGIIYMLLFSKSIPESPRWLLARGRISEAEAVLEKIARRNGQILDKRLIQTKQTQPKTTASKSYGIHTLLTHESIRLKMVILMLIWLINGMVYYGLSFNSKNIQGNRYWNFFLSGLVEVPSYFVAVPMIDNLGRQKSLFLSVMFGSIGCLACAFGPPDFASVTANIGKFGISSSFGILYIYSAELVPTVIRNFAMGTCSMTARFGGILAPIIVTLVVVDQKLPMILFAGSGVFAGLIGLFLPETLNNPVPERLDEINHQTREEVTVL